MNVLEKILEEIKQPTNYTIMCGRHFTTVDRVEEIIRSHMDNAPNTNVGEWIPVDNAEHTPKDEGYVLVSFSNFNVPGIARYEENEEGGTYYPGDDEESYLKYGLFVNGWKPIPKPYRPDPCHGCFGAANNDCGNCENGGGSSE